MQHGERERSLQVEVARLQRENERLEGTLASAFGDLRESEKRAEKAEAECEIHSQLHAATALDLVESQEALAAARRECEDEEAAHMTTIKKLHVVSRLLNEAGDELRTCDRHEHRGLVDRIAALAVPAGDT